ncbi:MAG TPA: hypothetical protein VFS64_04300 [Solirubrobacterales bacterium]|nr:hypothetical protein [Solirubrobacterales bacterium]
MVATELEVIFRTEKPGVRVRWRRSQAPPPYTYAVTVEVEHEKDVWRTVRLWDNADAVDEHHVHEYTGEEGKQDPIIRSFKAINEAMAAAIAEARRNAVEIVRQWEEA